MIKEFQEKRRFPVIGKIRLGIRKKTESGKEYPAETEYFVLDDAPDVAKVYGEKPKSLEVMFPSDDLNLVIPHFYKWYSGGVKNKDGDVVGGKLNCYGDGDVAHYLAKRDPVTRVVPTRKCDGKACVDWMKGGQQQCKAAMSVFMLLPRVSLLGLYQIDTTSVAAIQNFVNQMYLLKETWGTFKKGHFIIYRDPTMMSFADKDGKEQRREHYILRVRPDENFQTQYGNELQQRVTNLISGSIHMPSEQVLIEATMEDNFPTETAAPPQVAAPAAGIELVAEDVELAPLFEELCKLKGKANNAKMRLLTARKKEKEADPKAALKAYLLEEIEKSKKPAQAPADLPPAAPVQQPSLTAEGLI